MNRHTHFSSGIPIWFILTGLIIVLAISGCAEMSIPGDQSTLTETGETSGEESVTAQTPDPPPTLQEVQDALSSTKALLEDHEKQIGGLLSLRGEVKQTLREFRDQNLSPMNATIETLQHHVEGWEETVGTNQTTTSSTIAKLEKDLEQAQARVAVYGDQVTALVDQIDQNNRRYEKLLTEFQDSLVGFKDVMGEYTVTLNTEKERAIQKEVALEDQLKKQQETLDQMLLRTNDILVLQKRLNQLHVYINQVRDTITSDTSALKAALKTQDSAHPQEFIQTSPENPALAAQLQALEQRIETSEKHYAETVKALHDDMKDISSGMEAVTTSQGAENLQGLVNSLESLEERYQQLAQASSATPPALTEHLQALEQRVKLSEAQQAETVEALKHEIGEVSARMNTLATSLSAETVEALHHDIQEVSAGMMKLAQSISHLEKAKNSPTPIHTESRSAPEGLR